MRSKLQDQEADLLEKLWSDPELRSRNKNFGRFRDDVAYRKAVKLIRSLLAFKKDLIKYQGQSQIEVKWLASGKAARITLVIPPLRLRRTIFVSKPELDLLRKDPIWDDSHIVFREDHSNGRDKKQ